MHLVDIMLEDATGKRLDWGSVALDVASSVMIAETQVVDEVYRAGESVTVSGQPATCAGGAFSLAGVSLSEGPNDLLLVATTERIRREDLDRFLDVLKGL